MTSGNESDNFKGVSPFLLVRFISAPKYSKICIENANKSRKERTREDQ
jgi:hypothetical protein